MIICFTAHVSDGRNANLEEVQSLDFLAASFHSALTFHVVPLQRLRAGEAGLGSRGVDRSQISPLATPPSEGHGSAGQLTLTSVPIQDPDLQFK